MLAGLVRIRLYTTKINRKQSPDTGIEPETSDMPGKRATFIPWKDGAPPLTVHALNKGE